MSNRRPSGSSYGATRPGYAAQPVSHNQTLRLPNAPPLPPLPGRSKLPPPLPAPPAHAEAKRTSARPAAIEVDYVDEAGVDAHKQGTWTLYEIWTRNRVYHVDANLHCIAVVSRSTGRAELTHPLRGARLTGGERRNKSAHLLEIFVPLPAPGTEAVFRSDAKKHGQFAKTSTIEKVVVRVRRVRVASVAEGQAWDDVLGRSRPR
jgi:hypothetical protein